MTHVFWEKWKRSPKNQSVISEIKYVGDEVNIDELFEVLVGLFRVKVGLDKDYICLNQVLIPNSTQYPIIHDINHQ